MHLIVSKKYELRLFTLSSKKLRDQENLLSVKCLIKHPLEVLKKHFHLPRFVRNYIQRKVEAGKPHHNEQSNIPRPPFHV